MTRKIVHRLMRPIARLCLARGITIGELVEAAKSALYEVAAEQLSARGARNNVNRLSAMTGLHRLDLKRLIARVPEETSEATNVVRGVITRWSHHHAYLNAEGQPRVLSCGTAQSQFSLLCREVSTSVTPSAVLFELERTNRVRRVGANVELLRQVNQVAGDELRGFEILARDIDTAIQAVSENLIGDYSRRNAHFSTQFKNIYARDSEEVRQWLVTKAGEFHKEARSYLAARDKDLNPEFGPPNEPCIRVNLATVSFIESSPE